MQIGDEFVVMVETTITANGKTIENPIIRVTRPQAGFNPRFVYFVDNQTVGQPRHWYVGDSEGNVVVSDVNVVDSTTSTALATALTDQLTAAGYLSGTHTGTVNDVPSNYTKLISIEVAALNVVNINDLQLNERYVVLAGEYVVPLYATLNDDVLNVHLFGSAGSVVGYPYAYGQDVTYVYNLKTLVNMDSGLLSDILAQFDDLYGTGTTNTVYDEGEPTFSFEGFFEI